MIAAWLSVFATTARSQQISPPPSHKDSTDLATDSALFRTILDEALSNARLVAGGPGIVLLQRAAKLNTKVPDVAGAMRDVSALRERHAVLESDVIVRDLACSLLEFRRLDEARHLIDALPYDTLSAWQRVRLALQLTDLPYMHFGPIPTLPVDTTRSARLARLHEARTRIDAVTTVGPRFEGFRILAAHALELGDTVTARIAIREAVRMLPKLDDRQDDRTALLAVLAISAGELDLSRRLANTLHSPEELTYVAEMALKLIARATRHDTIQRVVISSSTRQLAHALTATAATATRMLSREDRQLAMTGLRTALLEARDTAFADSIAPAHLYGAPPYAGIPDIAFLDTLRNLVERHDYARVRVSMDSLAGRDPGSLANLWADHANALDTNARDTALVYAFRARRILAATPLAATRAAHDDRDNVLAKIAQVLFKHRLLDSAMAVVNDIENSSDLAWSLNTLGNTYSGVDAMTLRRYAAMTRRSEVRDALLAHVINAWMLPKARANDFAPILVLIDSLHSMSQVDDILRRLIPDAIQKGDTSAIRPPLHAAVDRALNDVTVDDWALSLWTRRMTMVEALAWARAQPTPQRRARALIVAAAMAGAKMRGTMSTRMTISNGSDSCREDS